MDKQEVTFNQSSWSNEEQATTQKADIKSILGQVFGWLLRAVLFVIATPFYIVIWTINFIKSLFGMFVMWIVGKFCLSFFVLLVMGFLGYIKLVTQETAYKVFNTVKDFFFVNPVTGQGEPFPYFEIEVWIIVILALIIATFSTIYRDEL